MFIVAQLSQAGKALQGLTMKRETLTLILILLLFPIPACSDADWRFVSPMPHARYGHDATLGPDRKIYVMGGYVWYFHNGMYSNLVYEPGWLSFMIFDPEKKEWRYVGKIKGEKNYYRIYDRVTRKFRYRQIPPEEIRKTNVQWEGDGVAIVTGSAVSVLDTVECYDPGTNKWEYKMPMSSERMLFASVHSKKSHALVEAGF